VIIAPNYGDLSATYGSEEIHDRNLVDVSKGNTGLFNGFSGERQRTSLISSLHCSLTTALQNTLFSAIVAAFIIEIYKTHLPTNSQQTTDNPPSSAVRINAVLFLSSASSCP
jgi:hypothetical protein